MVNFFVVAGCSDLGTASCEITIDGSQTAGFGIKFADAAVTLSSESGFAFPQTALAVPEPQTGAMLLGGLALLGWRMRRRQASGSHVARRGISRGSAAGRRQQSGAETLARTRRARSASRSGNPRSRPAHADRAVHSGHG